MKSQLTYYDRRFGDTYEIFLTPTGEFSSVLRYVEAVGRDPIVYDFLSEIPAAQRNAIECLIWKNNSPHSR